MAVTPRSPWDYFARELTAASLKNRLEYLSSAASSSSVFEAHRLWPEAENDLLIRALTRAKRTGSPHLTARVPAGRRLPLQPRSLQNTACSG